MRCRRADAWPVDTDQADVVVLGIDPGLRRNLPTRPRRPMQPENRTSLRSTEFREADLSVFANCDVSFELRAGNSNDHDRELVT